MTDGLILDGPLDPVCEMGEALTEMTPFVGTVGLDAGGRAATVVITEDAGGDLEPNCC
jgi:hypothetical protein